MTWGGTIALLIVVLGGLNWGLVGLFGIDPVGWALGPASIAARALDVVVGIAALVCLYRLPRWSRAS